MIQKQESSSRCLYVRFWDPEAHGKVYGTTTLFCLTQQENREDPSVVPEMILACVYVRSEANDDMAFFLTWETFPRFFRENPHLTFCVYDIGKTLAALAGAFEDPMELYDAVDKKRFMDVHNMSRLAGLAFDGDPVPFKSIADCLKFADNQSLKKDLHRFCLSPPDVDEFLNAPEDVPPQDLNMMVRAARAILQLHFQLQYQNYGIPDTSDSAAHFGLPDDPEWQRDREEEFGILTHDIQTWTDIVYTDIYRNGVHVDVKRVRNLLKQGETKLANLIRQMGEYGYEHDPEYLSCDDDAVRKVLEEFGEENNISFTVNGGKTSLAKKVLKPHARKFGFIPLYLQAKELDRRLSILDKMNKPRLHPKYQILATTGRVYASGDLAIQTVPREGGIRECIVPAPGHVFVIADYAMLEMVTLAQALISQFGYETKLADMINAGGDIHTKVAAMIFNKEEETVTKEERNHAKVLNFGLPGGLGPKGLCKYANLIFEIEWNEEEARQMRERWLDLFPEVRRFLNNSDEKQIGVWTGTGRFCRTSKYTELLNTIFQGLGADGMNLALKRLWLHDYRIAVVIHDEVLIEVPESDDYTEVVGNIERLMIEGMRQVAPDMLIRVESAVSTCWSKKAEKVHDDRGRLLAWRPEPTASPKGRRTPPHRPEEVQESPGIMRMNRRGNPGTPSPDRCPEMDTPVPDNT